MCVFWILFLSTNSPTFITRTNITYIHLYVIIIQIIPFLCVFAACAIFVEPSSIVFLCVCILRTLVHGRGEKESKRRRTKSKHPKKNLFTYFCYNIGIYICIYVWARAGIKFGGSRPVFRGLNMRNIYDKKHKITLRRVRIVYTYTHTHTLPQQLLQSFFGTHACAQCSRVVGRARLVCARFNHSVVVASSYPSA